MKKANQLTRIDEFVENLTASEKSESVILLDTEMDSMGADSPASETYQNGGNCQNQDYTSCSSNGGNCTNFPSSCMNSTNKGHCINMSAVSGTGCMVAP